MPPEGNLNVECQCLLPPHGHFSHRAGPLNNINLSDVFYFSVGALKFYSLAPLELEGGGGVM